MASILFNNARICNPRLKWNSLKNQKLFLNYLFQLWKLRQISNILKKEMMVIGNVFPKLKTVKNFVTAPCKKFRFGIRFDSQHVKLSQILAKSPWERFYHVFSSFWEKSIWKMSPVLLGQILGMLLNRLFAEGKYLIEDWENFQLRIQMQLSETRKSFSEFFVPFMETTLRFKDFEQKRWSS